MPETEELHLVRSNDTLDASWVIDEISESLADIGEWITEAQEHERTALAVWEGQSADGRKWAANYGKKVFPFDGAADSRVHLSGMAVDELTMLEMLAADNAKVQVIAMEASDAAASKRVETLMKYETRQRMRGELWRERNFAKQWKHTFGHAVMHIGWESRMGTAKATLTTEDLVKQETEMTLASARLEATEAGVQPDEAGEVLTPEQKLAIADTVAATVEGMILDDDPDAAAELVRRAHPLLSMTRARRVVKTLRQHSKAEFASPFHKPGKPCVQALIPGIEVFYPWWSHVIDKAPWVARVMSLSEPELRAKPKTDGWDKDAVEALLALGPVKVIEAGAVMQAMSSVSERMFNEPARQTFMQRLAAKERMAYEVLHVTVQTVDEDGYPAVQEVILHPSLCGRTKRASKDEKVLLNRLVDYYHDGGCYVELRREYKSRPLFESRGVPEIAGTHQWLLKSTRDAGMDRTSFATMPIVKVNSRKAGQGARWDMKPGTKLGMAAGDEAEYMQPPRLDQGSILDSEEIKRDAAALIGLHHAEVPPEKTQMHHQWIVTGGLLEEREIMLRILAMDQQFMDPLFVSRVIGNGPMPFQVSREEIAGSFDFVLEFDVKSLDMEYLEKRWSAMKDAFSIPGVAGQLPTIPVVTWLLNNIDPGLSDMVVGGMSERNAAEAEQEKAAIAMMIAGVEPSVTESMDAQTRMAAIQEQLAQNPIVAANYAQGGPFAAMLNARMQAFQFAVQQQTTNATTGRTGFKPVMEQQADIVAQAQQTAQDALARQQQMMQSPEADLGDVNNAAKSAFEIMRVSSGQPAQIRQFQ